MQMNITQIFQKSIFKRVLFLSLSLFVFGLVNAQTISTAGGTNYAGNFSINNPAPLLESFVIENTTAVPIMLTTVNTQMANYFTATAGSTSVNKLFYSATSLSGVFDVSTAAWTQIGSGNSVVPAALTVLPALTCINFVIPANTQYRFALEMTKGLAFSFTPTPTPNVFTVGGVSLKLGTAQIAGSAVGYAGLSPAVPAGNAGAFFGGSVVLVPAVACTAAPAPGTTISNLTTVCAGSPFNLSIQNCISASGITYQWQSAASATGPWTNISGATSSSLAGASQSVATFYQCVATCVASALTGTSTPVQVLLTPTSACYCANAATDPADEDIFNVTLGTLNNSSTCTSVGPGPGSVLRLYSNYTSGTGAPAAPNVIQGAPNPVSVQVGTCGGNFGNMVAIWIDLNQDGTFQHPTERVFISPVSVTGPNTQVGNVAIPSTALLGNTRMRVQVREFGTAANMLPCGTFTWGEVEDYNVNIVPCVPLSLTTQPVSTSVGCGANTTFTVAATGSIPSYQWQVKTPTGVWINLANTAPYSGVTTATLTITTATAVLNANQYRAVYTGACSGPDFSSPATLTVNAYIPPVTPIPAVMCAGSSLQLYASPPPTVTSVVSAANLNLAILDGVATGVNHTLSVAGIPAGATITNITVNLNVQHTYVADLMVVLRAPNGGILNLSNLIGGGNNPGVDFTNTKFSSATGLPALNTGTSPGYTGTFRPDAAGPVGAFGVPGGPTGFLPSVANFAGLGTTGAAANGNWTIAMFDAGPPDVGQLKDWSISITWGVTPATAVFSPVTNLWLNAGLTIPYAGTAVNTVYTNTPASIVYSAAVSNVVCSANTTIPVTVNAPLAGTLAVANVASCVGNTAAFAVTGITGGTGLTYQWQSNSIASPVFANIAGATSSSYTIPAVAQGQDGNGYRVIVSATGCTGSSISTAGTLKVNTNPVVTIGSAPIRNLFPGLTSTLTAAVSSATAPITYQWTRNGLSVAGATANTTVVTIDGLGSYTVNVKDANGCVNTGGLTIPASIEIADSMNIERLFIYPSPNSGQFQVRYYNVGRAATVVNVYDNKGALVFSKAFGATETYSSMRVDLGIHGRGIYRVDVVDARGERIKTGSVMVF
jgi:subtilisin-like proprotein convertase family protein